LTFVNFKYYNHFYIHFITFENLKSKKLRTKVIIASKSPVKIQAVEIAFKKVFPNIDFLFESLNAPSGVSDQPKNDAETYKGAKNRTNFALKEQPNNDFWIGIEGGIDKFENETIAYAWIYIKSKTKIGKAKTATFFLPEKISNLLEQGIELGEADDIVFGLENSKKKNGAVGILTKNVSDRTKYYSEAIVLALIPFINENLY